VAGEPGWKTVTYTGRAEARLAARHNERQSESNTADMHPRYLTYVTGFPHPTAGSCPDGEQMIAETTPHFP